MPGQDVDLQSKIQQLQSRLEQAKSDLQSIRRRTLRPAGIAPLALAVAASAVLFMAAAPPPDKVKAPFFVVDAAGKKIFEVVETDIARGFGLYNSSEQRVVIAGAGLDATFFKAISADNQMQASMGVVDHGKTPVLTLRYGGDAANRVTVAVTDGKPSMDMKNDKDVLIAQAGVGSAGGGYVLLLDTKKQPSVLFGVTAKNSGKVITYPNSGVGGDMAGLKGTMICGQAGCQ